MAGSGGGGRRMGEIKEIGSEEGAIACRELAVCVALGT